MLRRRFLDVLARVGAGGAVALQTGCVRRESARVSFHVSGFTCVTCATGLETLLGRERGVIAVAASYPEGVARVVYVPGLTTEQVLAGTIEAMGFRAELLGSTAAS